MIGRHQGNHSMYHRRGFTLLEVLVALAVVAIALGAVVSQIGNNAGNSAYLNNKTLAHWVAMNKVAELQLEKDWPAPGSSSGDTLMAEHEWYWTAKVSTTEDNRVRRLDVSVTASHASDKVLASVIAYVGEKAK